MTTTSNSNIRREILLVVFANVHSATINFMSGPKEVSLYQDTLWACPNSNALEDVLHSQLQDTNSQ